MNFEKNTPHRGWTPGPRNFLDRGPQSNGQRQRHISQIILSTLCLLTFTCRYFIFQFHTWYFWTLLTASSFLGSEDWSGDYFPYLLARIYFYTNKVALEPLLSTSFAPSIDLSYPILSTSYNPFCRPLMPTYTDGHIIKCHLHFIIKRSTKKRRKIGI